MDDDILKFVYIPKSLSLISLTPLFDLQKQILLYFYNNIILKNDSEISVPNYYFDKFEEIV